jgi:hypothetical protein
MRAIRHSVTGLCLLSALAATGCSRAEGDPEVPPPQRPSTSGASASSAAGPSGPLVLELFTSQGCSSCPPADRLLAKLASSGTYADRQLAPLSFHVDYWNDLGWADPYSLPAWTARQNQYASALHDSRVYTPELVVGGASAMVGSDAGAVTHAIEAAARPALLTASGKWAADAVTVTASAPATADVWVAVWEDSTSTKVLRGENSGETLASTHVVRRLEHIAAAGQTATVTLKLDPSWHGTGAIAFAQGADRKISASALLPR